MTALTDYTPTGPDWTLPWADLDREYPFVRELAGCPQDPIYHAEGDVWIHTKMVVGELIALDAWRNLPEVDRRTLFAAAVLHDVAKPVCSREDESGRISSRGHSRRGAIMAREILWEQGVPFATRESVCGLIGVHQLPYYLIDREDRHRLAVEVSFRARADHLAILAEADVRGRICDDKQRLLDNVEMFREYAAEQGVLDVAYPFATDHARLLYFKDERRTPDAPAYFAPKADVVLMSGLPGSGKDHYLRKSLDGREVISLDGIRAELGVDPGEEQSTVIARAQTRARELLRAGQPFAWNATNLSRQMRGGLIDLFLAYNAQVNVVYVEVPAEVLFCQNRARAGVVPESVLRKMLGRWEVPDLREAHRLETVVRDA